MEEWVFSEEGWTKSKNWARRVLLLVAFGGLIGAAVAGVASFLYTRLAWSDLERHYLGSYLFAASPNILSSTGTYNLIVVGALPGRDYLATPADVTSRGGKFDLTAAVRSRGAITAWERQYTDVPHTESNQLQRVS